MAGNTLIDTQKALLAGDYKLWNIVDDYLANIHRHQDLNIYIEVYDQEAKDAALRIQNKISKKEKLGQLFGLVVSIKDVICYENHEVTAGSKILKGFKSQFTATAIQRLLDEDAIIIGRTNCDEFAMGSSNEHSVYGPTKNGVDKDRVPGGSSGAAAVSVQMDTCSIAIGSDTGGSVRQPAGFCGVSGFKPSYGRISRYGLIAYASSFDQMGILGKELEDIALVLEVMSGADEMDATCSTKHVDSYSIFESSITNKILYFPEVVDHPKLDKEIRESFKGLLSLLEEKNQKVNAQKFDFIEYLVPCYYVLTTAEAMSNLSRYDGIRYGYRSSEVTSFADLYHKTRTEGFGKEVKRRIMLGAFVLSSGYYDAYYTKAQKIRRLISDAMDKIFETYDFIILPTTPTVAWKIGELTNDPVENYLSDIFTVLSNLCGLPTISIPLGTNSNKLPYGVQIIGKAFEEKKLLSFASSVQSWHNY